MASPIPAPIKPYVDWFLREFQITVGALQEKGAKRFSRPLSVALILLLGAYMVLYRPPQAKSDALDAQIMAAKTIYDYGERYKTLRDQLASSYARLPPISDREQWLSNSVRELLDKEGLSADSFTPVQESEVSGLLFQKSSVALNLRFAEFYDLLLRMENARPLMHVEAATLSKVSDAGNAQTIGYCTTSYVISTMIPKKRF
jgi:hypothetical protein